MMQYSERDHLSWGWNGVNFADPTPHATFHMDIGSAIRPTSTLRIETIRVAQGIADSVTKPILVGLSGGIDSQVACLSFLELGCPFTPVITRLIGWDGRVCNDHDIKTAYEFCELFGLTPIIHELQLNLYLARRFIDLFKEHGPLTGAMAVHLAAVDKYASEYAYVIAGEIAITKIPNLEKLVYVEQVSIQQHMVKYGYEAVDLFFHYSPELMLSILDHDLVRSLNNAHEMVYPAFQTALPPRAWWMMFSLYYKPLIYRADWPELIQVRKWSGFENTNINYAIDLAHDTIKEFHPERQIIIPVDELVDHLVAGGGLRRRWFASDVYSPSEPLQ